jgi:hypothetical protein
MRAFQEARDLDRLMLYDPSRSYADPAALAQGSGFGLGQPDGYVIAFSIDTAH